MAKKPQRTEGQRKAHELASGVLETINGFCLKHTRERTDGADNTVYRFSPKRYMRVDMLFPEKGVDGRELLFHSEGLTTIIPLSHIERAYVVTAPDGQQSLHIDLKGTPFVTVVAEGA